MESSQRRPFLQTPAIQALIILCIALILALLAGQAIALVFGVGVTSIPFAFLHGALAAGIAYLHRMASWWAPILFLFPPTAVLVDALHLPPALFFVIFLFLLLLFWSTFRSQVPFYPSGRPVWDAVAALLPVEKPLQIIDIGSGFGGAVLYLSRVRKDCRFVGIELAPLPWLISQVRAMLSGSRGNFVRGDYTRLNFADYDVIFAYLSPAAMTALWQKARSEMCAGTLLLSYEFAIAGVTADIAVQPRKNGPVLYGWHM